MMHAKALHPGVSGVLYAEDFDEPLIGQPATNPAMQGEPELIIPNFSLDELRAAVEQAREEEREAEQHAASISIAARREAALTVFAEQVRLTQHTALAQVEQTLDALAKTVLSLFAAALPALCARHAQAELLAVLHRVLPPVRQSPQLQIRAHPSVRELIEAEAEAMLEGSPTCVTWTDSDRLLPGDIAVSWNGGTVLRDTRSICHDISDAVLALFNDECEISRPEPENGQ